MFPILVKIERKCNYLCGYKLGMYILNNLETNYKMKYVYFNNPPISPLDINFEKLSHRSTARPVHHNVLISVVVIANEGKQQKLHWSLKIFFRIC